MNPAKTFTNQHQPVGLTQKEVLRWFELSFALVQHLQAIDVMDCLRVV